MFMDEGGHTGKEGLVMWCKILSPQLCPINGASLQGSDVLASFPDRFLRRGGGGGGGGRGTAWYNMFAHPQKVGIPDIFGFLCGILSVAPYYTTRVICNLKPDTFSEHFSLTCTGLFY